jgi:hypothetical protein
MRSAGAVELVAPDGPLRERAELLAAEIERTGDYTTTVASPGSPPARTGRAVRIVLGVLADADVARLAQRVGVTRLAGGGFEVRGRSHRGESDAFVAACADPERPGLPLVLIAGDSAAHVALRARELPAPWEPRLRTWSEEGLDVRARLDADGTIREETLRLGAPSSARLQEGPAAPRSFTLLVEGEVPAASRDAYAAACERAAVRVREWFGAETERAPVQVVLHAHAQDHLRGGDVRGLGSLDHATLRVDALVAPGLPTDGGAALARATALGLGGAPAARWLEDAVGVAAAGTWWGRPLAEWGEVLRTGGLLPEPAELLQPGTPAPSEHVLVPARALLLVDALARGADLGALWRGEELPEGTSVRVSRDEDLLERLGAERAGRRTRALATPLRGVALFEAGASAYGGDEAAYGAHSVAASLARAREHGANALSLTVQATSAPPRPVLVDLDARGVHGSACDVALASAVAAARTTGDLRVLLAVEPLYGPGSSWSDTGLFARPTAIDRFFGDAEHVALHYALLAELLGVEALSVGSGMASASRTRADAIDPPFEVRAKEDRAAGWAALVERVRGVFGGAVTYAAHTGLEARSVGHWEVFDLVGLLGFGRLTRPGEDPTDASVAELLTEHLADGRALALEVGRPLLFVQLGFPARSRSFGNPAVPAGPLAPEEQERYYRALEAVLSGGDAGQGVGLFLWNWNLDPDSRLAGGFSPLGSAAEQHLAGILRLR